MTLVGDLVTGQPVSFKRWRQMMEDLGGGLQEGVVNAGDLKVSQRAAGANMSVDIAAGQAWIAVDTGSLNGLSHGYSDAVENRAITASNATLPRVDQLIFRYNDTTVGTGAGNAPTLEVLTGTATTGAQITAPQTTATYRLGAAALPADAIRLADILVRAATTSILSTDIVDRRPWARGAFTRLTRAATDLTSSSATLTAMDTTNLRARVECSGVPVRITFQGIALHTVAATNLLFGALFDGVQQEATFQQAAVGANLNNNFTGAIVTIPSAGSHLIDAAFATAAATMTVRATAALPFYMTIEEIVRPNANNGTA